MDYIYPICTLILVLVLPFVINLVKNSTWDSSVKLWVAIIFSGLSGLATGLIGGIPDASTLVTWVLSVVGGVQVAYTAFKSAGVTSKWLDALEDIDLSKKSSKF